MHHLCDVAARMVASKRLIIQNPIIHVRCKSNWMRVVKSCWSLFTRWAEHKGTVPLFSLKHNFIFTRCYYDHKMKQDETVGACGGPVHGRHEECLKYFSRNTWKEQDMGNLSTNRSGPIVDLENMGARMWTGFIWLRGESRLLWTR
jgi:hypothetical protein